jgi:hypothetical protein
VPGRVQRQASLARPRSAPAGPRRGKDHLRAGGMRSLVLVNEDWDRLASRCVGGNGKAVNLEVVLQRESLEGARDIKRWEQQLLQVRH